MKEDDNKEKILTQIEIDNIIDETINLSIISKLLKLELINEKQFYVLKEKMSNRFEPAIENHLLEIVEINVSKEELDKYIKAK